MRISPFSWSKVALMLLASLTLAWASLVAWLATKVISSI